VPEHRCPTDRKRGSETNPHSMQHTLHSILMQPPSSQGLGRVCTGAQWVTEVLCGGDDGAEAGGTTSTDEAARRRSLTWVRGAGLRAVGGVRGVCVGAGGGGQLP